jgi:hypothetical protein
MSNGALQLKSDDGGDAEEDNFGTFGAAVAPVAPGPSDAPIAGIPIISGGMEAGLPAMPVASLPAMPRAALPAMPSPAQPPHPSQIMLHRMPNGRLA